MRWSQKKFGITVDLKKNKLLHFSKRTQAGEQLVPGTSQQSKILTTTWKIKNVINKKVNARIKKIQQIHLVI